MPSKKCSPAIRICLMWSQSCPKLLFADVPSLNLQSGEVCLRHMKMRKEILNKLDTPFEVDRGYVGEISIQVHPHKAVQEHDRHLPGWMEAPHNGRVKTLAPKLHKFLYRDAIVNLLIGHLILCHVLDIASIQYGAAGGSSFS